LFSFATGRGFLGFVEGVKKREIWIGEKRLEIGTKAVNDAKSISFLD
jgi:hypothetical protein